MTNTKSAIIDTEAQFLYRTVYGEPMPGSTEDNHRKGHLVTTNALIDEIERVTGLDLGTSFRVVLDLCIDQAPRLYVSLYADERLKDLDFSKLADVETFIRPFKENARIAEALLHAQDVLNNSDPSDPDGPTHLAVVLQTLIDALKKTS